MTDSNNSKIVQEAYAAFGRGDIPGLLAMLSEDVQWDHAGPSEIPWAGSFRGHDGVVKFFTAIGENCDFLSFEPQTFLADQDRVVVLGSEKIKHKVSGREWETPWAHVYTVKDGKITTFREYTDTAAVAAACRS
jgi:ketosteroid isomerase-like protein